MFLWIESNLVKGRDETETAITISDRMVQGESIRLAIMEITSIPGNSERDKPVSIKTPLYSSLYFSGITIAKRDHVCTLSFTLHAWGVVTVYLLK